MAKEYKNKQNRVSKNEAMNALDDIHEKYTKLLSTDIEKFAPVYYPIAIIEMNLDETTFEDFESVQYSILNLYSLGIVNYAVIAETLGLSSNYVFKVIRLLNSYGHLDDRGITELGQDSIKSGKKIVKSKVWQKFQMDALNGTLLKVEQTITENMLNDREQTRIKVGHLNYLDGMSVEDISSQVMKNKGSTYIRQKSSILNVNVTAINDVRCVEVKYAKCYMMKLRNCDEPIVFAKRYDSAKKEVKDRFSWAPFSIKSKVMKDKYGFENDIPFSTDIAKRYVLQLFDMLMIKARTVHLVEEIKNTMNSMYPFDESGVTIARTDGVVVPTVNLDERAFMKYRSWIINFLIGIQREGEYLVTHENLYGNIISLRTDSLLILDVAELLDKKINQYGKLEIIKLLKSKYKDYDGPENLISVIAKELSIGSRDILP